MLRIAVIGADAQRAHSAGLRLRSAVIAPCDTAGGNEPILSADAVAFVGTGPAEYAAVSQVLESRKHVLLATMSGLAATELDRLAERAQQQGVVLTVTNPQHALPSRRLIRQQIESGKLGGVGLLRISRGEPNTEARAGLPPALISDIDLAQWLIGRPPETVYATQRDRHNGGQRCVHLHLGFSAGCSALVTYTSIWPSQDAHHSLSVIAASGAAYADDHQNRQLLYGAGAVTAPAADECALLATLLSDFVNAVQSGCATSECHPTWRKLATIVSAVEQSLASRDAVPVECP